MLSSKAEIVQHLRLKVPSSVRDISALLAAFTPLVPMPMYRGSNKSHKYISIGI